MPKTRVLILIDWYQPGYKAGGPIQSVANLVASLNDDIEFSIVTRDTDFGDSQPYSDIESDVWIDIQRNVRVQYLSDKNQNRKGLKRIVNPSDFDYIYLNSVFSYKFTILPLLAFKSSGTRIVLAPRGMLGSGALQIKSLKKKIFVKLASFPGLFDDITWQATNDAEKEDIYKAFGNNARVLVASNIPSRIDGPLKERTKDSGELRLVYLSRISAKKNVLTLLDQLKGLRVTGSILLDLYGPIEDQEYWGKCQKIIHDLPDNIVVEYKGAIQPSEIPDVLSRYHFFTLLTLHENFGHAIFEALAVGCPLIISDTTPWRNLEAEKIGWDISLDNLKSFDTAITFALQMDQAQYTTMSIAAHQYALDYLKRDSAVEQSRKIFTEQ